MRTPRTLRAIAEVARTAQHPERLHHLLALIEDGLGYGLYQAVSSAKAELSRAETATLRFSLELTKTSVQRLRCSGVEPGSRASPQAPFSHVSKLWRGYT